MTNADLRELLTTLREFGVSEYRTPDLTLLLTGKAEPARVARPGEDATDSDLVEPEAISALPDLDDEDGDPIDYLARIHAANYKRADAGKGAE